MTTRRAVLSLLTLALAGTALLIAWRFDSDMQRARARAAQGSVLLQTRCGPIEYQETGAGVPMLVVHGSGRGHDQGMAFAGAHARLDDRRTGNDLDAAGAKIVKRALRGNGQGFEAHDVFGAARQVHFTGGHHEWSRRRSWWSRSSQSGFAWVSSRQTPTRSSFPENRLHNAPVRHAACPAKLYSDPWQTLGL